MNAKHSPLPWKLRDGQTRRGGYLILSDKVNEAVLEIIPSNLKDIDDKATAEFIVRAGNSHEALLKAAKSALRYMEYHGDSTLEIRTQLKDAITKTEEAL